MRRNLRPIIFRRRFNPASIFANGASGLWLDPSDISTGYQDSAGTTPITASGQFVGKRSDKSGRGNHVLQAGATARPEWDLIGGVASDFFDGSDDAYATAAFAAGTLVSDMDCFIAVKRATAANFMLLWGDTSAKYLGAANSTASGSQADAGVGSNVTYAVNGSNVVGGTGTTEAQLHSAITVGSWVVVEARNADLSLWTQAKHSGFTAYFTSGDIGGIIVCPAQSTATRTQIRKWLGAKVGLSL